MSAAKNLDDESSLEELAEAVMSGDDVDWGRLTTLLGPRHKGLLDQFRTVTRIMDANRAKAAPVDDDGNVLREWGPVRIVAAIGSGAFGDVFRARDLRLDRDIALKLVHPFRIDSVDDSTDFAAEARLLARVRHRNLVTVHGAEEYCGRVGIMMELIEGDTVEGILRVQGPMSSEEALLIGRDVARALAALHRADILHRDIKARNVMREVGGRVVLMDLGIGCRTDAGRWDARLGTPLYAAPEILCDRQATGRSDIYSVGVLLFHLVTGTYPVVGETLDEIQVDHLADRRQRLRDLRPGLPESFVTVVERATAHDPQARHPSAGELVAELVAAVGERPRTRTRSHDRGTPPSIAVLPFRDLSPNGDHAYLCEGLAEQIIHALFQLQGLRVIARTSSFFYKDHRADIREIGRHLGVTTLLDGSVRVDGDRIRIAAQLLDAGDASHLWSAQYEYEAGHVLRVEDKISRAVVDRLAGHLIDHDRPCSPTHHSADAVALHHYLQGRHLFNRGTRRDVEAARDRFQEAVVRDPGYALAHAGVAASRAYLYAYRHVGSREQLRLARSAAARAVELDPSLAETQSIRGFVHLLWWEWDAARVALELALARNPKSVTTRHYYAHYLVAVARLDEACSEMEACVAVDPVSRFAHGWLALYRVRAGRLAAARAGLQPLTDTDGCPPLLRIIVGRSYVLEQRYEEGIAELERAQRETDGDPIVVASLGWAYGLAGRRVDACRMLAALKEERSLEPVRPFLLARVHAALGELDQAFAWLERSVAERDPYLMGIKTDETVAPLRDDPRFAAILRRINLA